MYLGHLPLDSFLCARIRGIIRKCLSSFHALVPAYSVHFSIPFLRCRYRYVLAMYSLCTIDICLWTILCLAKYGLAVEYMTHY